MPCLLGEQRGALEQRQACGLLVGGREQRLDVGATRCGPRTRLTVRRVPLRKRGARRNNVPDSGSRLGPEQRRLPPAALTRGGLRVGSHPSEPGRQVGGGAAGKADEGWQVHHPHVEPEVRLR